MNISRLFLYFFLILVLAFSGCNPTRNIPEGQHLLNRNRVDIEDAEVKTRELRHYIRQKPNRRILGLYRFHLNVYQLADRGRENRFKRWMKNTIGEPPVIFDPVLADNTERQFELYMQSKGYFNTEVSHEVDFRRKRANVSYQVTGNKPYTIRNITYNIADNFLEGFVLKDTTNSLLKRQQRYDADNLQKERDRISRHLRNQGFFNFSREFIFFRVDSTLASHQVDIDLVINSPASGKNGLQDSLVSQRHRRFVIDKIQIYPEYSRFRPNILYPDTTRYIPPNGREENDRVYTFYHDGDLRIKAGTISRNILLDQGDYYRERDVEQTYNYLSGLRSFRLINVQFSESEDPIHGEPNDTIGFLNARVQLARSPANAFTIEAEGLNSAGNLGVAGNLLFQNRNTFRGAEILNLRLKGALEVSGESAADEVLQRLPFNTIEMGAELSLDFPKLLLPFSMERLSRYARPKSTILTGINYRQRPDYTRYVLNVSYGFEWSENPQKRHFLHPLEVSSIKIFNDSILQSKIPEGNPLILSRFRDHLTAGLKYSYVYNTQQIGRDVDFVYFRANLESSGNLMNIAAKIFDVSKGEDGSYTFFNIPFAQYIRSDLDFRYYRVFDQHNTLAFRIMGGAGLPYGNLDVLPFIKSYYGGGANGVRAWKIYHLGPGSYGDTSEGFDKYGDIKLEANVEYRFAIYGIWHGAFFVDAGNVWFSKENPQFPGGDFSLDRFYKEIAVGAGPGLRMDFDFFVVRVDAAFPLHDPSKPLGERWSRGIPRIGNWNFNLGIGYPF